MKKILVVFALASSLLACESLYEVSDIAEIRSQRQVDAYNASVTAEEDKLVCTREKPLGSNIPRFACMTVAQQSRLEAVARDELQRIR